MSGQQLTEEELNAGIAELTLADYLEHPSSFGVDEQDLFKFNLEDKRRFLLRYAETGRLQESANAAGTTARTIRNHCDKDPIFEAACLEAKAVFCDKLEETMYRRGVEGWDEPVIGGRNKDQVVCTVRKYSDRLLEVLAKRHIPEMTPNRNHNHKVDAKTEHTGTVALKTAFDFNSLSDDKLVLLRQLLQDEETDAG